MSMNTGLFTGPLFIVGISRSGTKLLRDLLNNHSRIAIPTVESKFIPRFYQRFGQWDEAEFKEKSGLFFNQFKETQFYEELIRQGRTIDEEEWRNRVKRWTLNGVIEVSFKMTVKEKGGEALIWGDKTPNYLLYIPLLKQLFPDAKFIHIIRDVRDVCLSARKAWGRNIYVTAQRWYDYISKCRREAEPFKPDSYIEVRYEDLVQNPGEILPQLTAFLGLAYENHMTELNRPPEEVGDARGATAIISANTQKWKKRLDAGLSTRQIKKIEAMCFPLLKDLAYPLTNPPPGKAPVRLNRPAKTIYAFLELFSFLRAGAGKEGLKATFKKLLKKIRFRLTP